MQKRIELIRRRKELGLTQSDLVIKIKKLKKNTKITQSHYSKIESGEKNPSLKLAIIISKILYSTVEKLFESEITI